jgi:alpha-glucosidase (family GH31 glycosyl hydrolase)
MPQQEFVPKKYTLQPSSSESSASVHLQCSEPQEVVDFTFEALKPGLFKTTFTSPRHPLPPFPSAAKPEPHTSDYNVISGDDVSSKTFRSQNIEATVEWTDVPIVSIGFTGQEPLHTDLPFRSYVLDGTGVAHYTRYHRNNLHIGLGEKAAPMDLSNRHFTLSATDCFGYDVHRTDPMYKHIPLLIRATPNGVIATFSTSHARGF